jgi:hypothetical protein
MDMVVFEDVLIAMNEYAVPIGIEDFIVYNPVADTIHPNACKCEFVSSVI